MSDKRHGGTCGTQMNDKVILERQMTQHNEKMIGRPWMAWKSEFVDEVAGNWDSCQEIVLEGFEVLRNSSFFHGFGVQRDKAI